MSTAFRVVEQKGIRDISVLPYIQPVTEFGDDIRMLVFDDLIKAREFYKRIAVYGVYTHVSGDAQKKLFIQFKSLDIIEHVELSDGSVMDNYVACLECLCPTQEDIDAGRIRL